MVMQFKYKRTVVPKIRMVILITSAVFFALFFIKGIVWISSCIRETGITPSTFLSLLFDTGADLSPINDRVNIVVLGIAGGDHDGSDLTDTILVFSFQMKNDAVGMISVPRDIWSDTLKDKVNSAYHYGKVKSLESESVSVRKKGGLILAKAIISDMVGLPIQYGAVFDFTKFQTIIDLVGGVTIDVPQAFTDFEYPIAGKENDGCGGDETYACRYESLHFDAGSQFMDGKRALAYVRTRHADGSEGSDFARGKRQQQVIVALKEKMTSREILWNVGNMKKLYEAFDIAVDTDMNVAQIATVGKLFLRTPQSRIKRISIEHLLYDPPVSWYGRYVLLPQDSFLSIHDYIQTQLK